MRSAEQNRTPESLGSPGCPEWAGGEACRHPVNELGICANGLCPIVVEVTPAGRQALRAMAEETQEQSA